MILLITATIITAIVLAGNAMYGWSACALFVAAFMLWWDGQPGPTLDQGIGVLVEERPRPKYQKGK